MGNGHAVGDRIERYQVAEVFELDEDSATYRVFDLESGGRHVLKLRFVDCDPVLHDALRREYRIQHSLNHPHIAHASRLFTLPDGTLGMVLDHASGGALSSWMTGKAVAPGMVRVVIEGVLKGLHAAHESGFVHRDVKPENVLLTQSPGAFVAKIADFGLAKDLSEGSKDTAAGLSLHYSLLGTPGYMSPEQAADPAAVDARADLYSVGCLLYEMLTGDLPYDPDAPGFMLTLLRGEWRRPTTAPDWAIPVLEALLSANPNDRPRSATAVLGMLRDCGGVWASLGA